MKNKATLESVIKLLNERGELQKSYETARENSRDETGMPNNS